MTIQLNYQIQEINIDSMFSILQALVKFHHCSTDILSGLRSNAESHIAFSSHFPNLLQSRIVL